MAWLAAIPDWIAYIPLAMFAGVLIWLTIEQTLFEIRSVPPEGFGGPDGLD